MKCLALFISFAYGIQPLFPFMIKVIFIFPNCNHDAIKLENNRYGNSTPQRVEVLPRRLRIIIKKKPATTGHHLFHSSISRFHLHIRLMPQWFLNSQFSHKIIYTNDDRRHTHVSKCPPFITVFLTPIQLYLSIYRHIAIYIYMLREMYSIQHTAHIPSTPCRTRTRRKNHRKKKVFIEYF